MKNTILLVSTLLSSAIWATPLPTKFTALGPLGKIQLYSSKEQATVIANLQNLSKALSGSSLSLPDDMKVLVPHNYNNAFFDPISVAMVSPYQINIEGAAKHPKFSRTVEMHEYGHAVFDENIEIVLKGQPQALKVLRAFKKSRTKLKNFSLIAKQAMIEGEILAELANKPGMTAQALEVDSEIINKRMEAEGKKIESFMDSALESIMAGTVLTMSLTTYNEFFADVVAVAMTNDPHAVSAALTLTRNKLTFHDRSFRRRLSQRSHNPQEHDFYTLSREFIFKYYLTDPVIRAKGKPWILTRTLESIACAFKGEEATDLRIENEFKRMNPKPRFERFHLERKNAVLNKCIEARFEAP